MTHPLVSVIIPTYKRTAEYLSRAVSSVQHQTYSNVEILVIDDSPDTYENRCEIETYMQSICGEKIKYFQNEKNIGGSLSRNRGIDNSKGDFVTFLDDDDEYMPEKVEKQLAFMIEGGYDLTFSNMIMYGKDGNVVDYREYKDIPAFDNKSLLHYHLMKHLTGTPTFMFKSDSLRKIGGFSDVKMGQEFYLMLKSIEQGLKIAYFPVCDVKVYKHADGGISQGKNKINGEKALYQFKKTYFRILSKRERVFIKFRHWAVMVIAYKRNGMHLKMLGAGFLALFSSPIDFFNQSYQFLAKILYTRKHNQEEL
ncbi:hypothetical protein SDC9_85468 [bioreactor metagenome]|uniref:Glycosyltransferase 2-like domain-containing protein n=1 Tax=bioreactor metagenome TaxID=1076179 RepID=A0A644ZEW5_9ZZZZ|nr:glycosyltransferase family 2 protein [Candidatus Metalachnospira sp.]